MTIKKYFCPKCHKKKVYYIGYGRITKMNGFWKCEHCKKHIPKNELATINGGRAFKEYRVNDYKPIIYLNIREEGENNGEIKQD